MIRKHYTMKKSVFHFCIIVLAAILLFLVIPSYSYISGAESVTGSDIYSGAESDTDGEVQVETDTVIETVSGEISLSVVDSVVDDFNISDEYEETDTADDEMISSDSFQKTVSFNDIDLPGSGEQYARIRCDEIGMDLPVFWNDTENELSQGIGHSFSSYFPGFGKVIILSGHTLTYFSCLQYIKPGDIVEYETSYGLYKYEVTEARPIDENELLEIFLEKTGYSEVEEKNENDITAQSGLMENDLKSDEEFDVEDDLKTDNNPADDFDESLKMLSETEEQVQGQHVNNEELIMYTCYPFYPIEERKTQRWTVFAKYIEGPLVVDTISSVQNISVE